MPDNNHRVVITGMGIVTPLGIDLDTVWTALLDQRCGLKRTTAFDPAGFRSQLAGEIPPFNLADFIPKNYRKNAKVMCRDIQIALAAAYLAVRDAGLKTKCLLERGEVQMPSNVDPTRFGANIGAGLICADLNELSGAFASAVDDSQTFDITKWGSEGMSNLTPLWLLKFLPNMLACHVTIVHDAQAPSNTITCGEASSHLAIGEAFRTIQRRDADVCICGGAESRVNCMGLLRQDLFGRLVRHDSEQGDAWCRPFDQQACGTAVAEGGGLIILEGVEHAVRRGAKIYGEIVGFGAACNTTGWREPDAQGRGIALAARNALADAGLTPDQITLIGTFGTGIPAYDRSEAAAWRSVLGSRLDRVPAMAIKGAIGTNGAGSGAIDFAMNVMAMRNRTIPPSVNTNQLADDGPARLVTGKSIDAPVENFLSLAYALSGGQTAALVVKAFSP